jgi:hypothetical protein|tara:strand:+ start:544 stop:771 length:228 start_codon:yes stop_codon:yes gene_type:complete
MADPDEIILHRQISELGVKVERLQEDVQRLYSIVTKQNQSLNRWRGMGAALTMVGVVFVGAIGGLVGVLFDKWTK